LRLLWPSGAEKQKAARHRAAAIGGWRALGLAGLGLHLNRFLLALDVAFTTLAFLHFVGLSAHNFFTLPNWFCWLTEL
jgi:hypothetical protein